MHQFAIQPVFNPIGFFVVRFCGPLSFFKKRVIHIAFCRRYKHYGSLMIAVVEEAVGNVTANGLAAVDVFVPPKYSTATDLFDLLLL